MADRERSTVELCQEVADEGLVNGELREALNELRHVLDVDRPLPAAARRSRRRSRLAVAGLAGIALVALVLVLLFDRGWDDQRPIVAGSPSGPGASARAGSARPLPDAGPPGSDVDVTVTPDGADLAVVERLQLEAPSGRPLALEATAPPSLGAGAHVVDLQVQLDDIEVPATPDGTASWTAVPPPGRTWSSAFLHYRIEAGVATVTPAARGRALGFVTPLTARISGVAGYPVAVRASGPPVLGVSCPTSSHAPLCGTRNAVGWTATIPADAEGAVVLLQLDL